MTLSATSHDWNTPFEARDIEFVGTRVLTIGPITPWPPRRGQITEWSLFRRAGGWHVGKVVW